MMSVLFPLGDLIVHILFYIRFRSLQYFTANQYDTKIESVEKLIDNVAYPWKGKVSNIP